MRIELLHFQGCPGFAEALNILQEELAEKRSSVEVTPVELGPEDRLSSPGSPTILVNGEDLFPVEERLGARAASCRIYATPEGPKNHPTAAMVREALARHFSEKRPVNPRSQKEPRPSAADGTSVRSRASATGSAPLVGRGELSPPAIAPARSRRLIHPPLWQPPGD